MKKMPAPKQKTLMQLARELEQMLKAHKEELAKFEELIWSFPHAK